MAAHEWFRNFDERLWLKGDEGAEREAGFIWSALHLRRGSRVLDAPCGAGRIARYLATAGCRVTWMDLMGAFVRRARNAVRKAGATGTFVAGDMRQMDFDGGFDAAYNWGGSFGFFGEEENRDVIRRYARALKPGGRLLIDQPNREFVLRHFRASLDAGEYKVRTKWNAASERIASVWTITGDERRSRSVSDLRLYTQGQLRRILAAAGFEVEDVFGDLEGGALRRGSRRIYIVGRKRKQP